MPITVLEHIKGSELPSSWKRKANIDSRQIFTVTLKPENEEDDMPPEEMFREEFIKKVEQSAKEARAGKGTLCKTAEESKKFLDALKTTAGGWADLVDCEELKKNIYADRQISTRPEVKL